MLEITSVRHGAVLNRHNGVESADCLEITLEGLAGPADRVTVNGVPAGRADRKFAAPVRLTGKFNEITVTARGNYGDAERRITVVWDKNSFPRYNFFIDDNIFCFAELAEKRPKSIFDQFYLGALREIHRKYGTKFSLNCFFRNDHFPFELSAMPDAWKGEWRDNADWLRLSFHSYSEFPDRPYQHAPADKLAADFDLVKSEIVRFAGEETFIPPMVLHWAMAKPAVFPVLKERGVKVLSGGYLSTQTYVGEKISGEPVCDIGYYYEKDVACYLASNRVFYDRDNDIFLTKSNGVCNLLTCEQIEASLRKDMASPFYRETFGVASHEQYSYPFYSAYIPDHHLRLETAARLLTENGYAPVFFPEGLFGNTAWG